MPENVMLVQTDIGEQLSYAYVHAVASKAGFAFERRYIDKNSVDATIHAKGTLSPDSVTKSPSIGIQAKSTTRCNEVDGCYAFPLEINNYNELRGALFTPTILVVLFLPADFDQWLTQNEQMLITKRCAYWVSLKDLPDSTNTTSVTVRIPKENVFTPDALRQMMVNVSIRRSVL